MKPWLAYSRQGLVAFLFSRSIRYDPSSDGTEDISDVSNEPTTHAQILQNNVIGLLFVKDLIFIDPEDGKCMSATATGAWHRLPQCDSSHFFVVFPLSATRVADVIDIFGRSLHVAWVDDKLGDVLRELKKGKSHMALVRDVNNSDETQDPFYQLMGIITLEDIIEEILQDEIVDETDVPEGMKDAAQDQDEAFRWARLRLLNSKIVDQNLSYEEARAVTAHLLHNFKQAVALLTEKQLHRLIADTPVTVLPTAAQEVSEASPKNLLYERNVVCDFATLVLTGKVTVVAGADEIRTDVSNWCLLGRNALLDPSYQPDFSAFVSSGPCRCIFIKRSRFAAAVDASVLERRSSANSGVVSHSEVPTRERLNSESMDELKEMTKQHKLLTALEAVEQSKTSDSSASGSTPSTAMTTDLIRRPSLINISTVTRSEATQTFGKGSR